MLHNNKLAVILIKMNIRKEQMKMKNKKNAISSCTSTIIVLHDRKL